MLKQMAFDDEAVKGMTAALDKSTAVKSMVTVPVLTTAVARGAPFQITCASGVKVRTTAWMNLSR